MTFNELGSSMSTLYRLSDARSRSISAENPTGEPAGGARATEGVGSQSARELGQGWKANPCAHIGAGETLTVADITGPGSKAAASTSEPRSAGA